MAIISSYRSGGSPVRGRIRVRNSRKGPGSYQTRLTRKNLLHNLLTGAGLHWFHAGLNLGRDANPVDRITSPLVKKAKKALFDHVLKLRVTFPEVESLSHGVNRDGVLVSATEEQFDERGKELLDMLFFHRGGVFRTSKTGEKKEYFTRIALTGDDPSPLQSIRLLDPIPFNLMAKALLKQARTAGPEAYLETQELLAFWDEDFAQEEIPRFLVDWTANDTLEDGSPNPATACRMVLTSRHRDTGLGHREVIVSEIEEVPREEAIEKGMPIDKPFGAAIKKFLARIDPDLPARLMGRAFRRVGSPQLGRQGPEQVGLQMMRRAGWKLQPDQQAHYDSRVYKGKAERGYGEQGLGIDVDLNDRYYSYCQKKAATLGLSREWEAAEAEYRAWLDAAVPLKQALDQARTLARLNFDEDQKKRGQQMRAREIETMRLQVQLALRDEGYTPAMMTALAKKAPLRKVSEAILDSLNGFSIPRLCAEARKGLESLIRFLLNLFENGVPARASLPAPDQDPDVLAAIARGVEEKASKLKPVVVEKFVEKEVVREIVREVKVPGPERQITRWKMRSYFGKGKERYNEMANILSWDLALEVPLIRIRLAEEIAGLEPFSSPQLKGVAVRGSAVRKAFEAQLKIMNAAIEDSRRISAELDEEERRQRAQAAAETEAAKEAIRLAEMKAEGHLVVGSWDDGAPEDAVARAEKIRQATLARNQIVARWQHSLGAEGGKHFSGAKLYELAGEVLAHKDPDRREARVLRLMRVCLKGVGKAGMWKPSLIDQIVIADAKAPYTLARAGEDRELEISQ